MTDDKLPRYILHQRLGAGGMGAVHLGTLISPAGERRVAIKRLLGHREFDAEATARLIAEARLVFQLTHVNICQVLDLGASDDGTFIVMEYVRGLDLRALLRFHAAEDRQLDVASAVYVAREIARALDYAHRRCDASGRPLYLVHGDVTPQNVLISIEGEVKLADFGIARALGTIAPGARLSAGTPGYVAPDAGPRDHRADIYSLGVTLHAALSRRPPRAGAFDPRGLRKLRPEVTLELARIVERATEPDPDHRFSSASELESALALELARRFPAFTPSSLARVVELYDRVRASAPQITGGETLVSIMSPTDDATEVCAAPEAAAPPPEAPPREAPPLEPAHTTTANDTATAARRVPPRGVIAAAALAVVATGSSVWVAWPGASPESLATRARSAPVRTAAPASSAAPAPPAVARIEPRPPPPPPPPPPARVQPTAAPRAEHEPRPRVRAAPESRSGRVPPSPPAAAPAEPPRMAYLTVNSIPWGAVMVDGKRVSDETPIYRLPLAPGAHQVRVVYLNQQPSAATQRVVLAPGEVRSIGFQR
jgi:hypothetical protein